MQGGMRVAGFDLESKFKLTGETGSYRYMAPEVFRHEPYNFKVPGGSTFDAEHARVYTLGPHTLPSAQHRMGHPLQSTCPEECRQ